MKADFRKAWGKFVKKCKKEGVVDNDLTLEDVIPVIFPYRTVGAKDIGELSPAVLYRVKNFEKETRHTVVVAYVPSLRRVMIWCADGLFTAPHIKKYEEIWEKYEEICETEGIEDKVPPYRDDECNFWRNEKTCKHTQFVQSLIASDDSPVKERIEALIDQYFAEEGEGSLDTELKNLAFVSHVLVEGEQGSGKTYTAFKVAEKLVESGVAQHIVIGQGDNSVEATDLLGYWVKDASGNLVWKDGVLTEAFRKAQKEKVILIFDEFYRLRDKEKDIFVRALTVFPDGKLRLRTGRVAEIKDGVAQEEVIEVPRENLWVIATTNVGSQFMVDEADPALAERFIPVRWDTQEDELRNILVAKCDERKIPHAVVGMLIRFWKGTKKHYQEGELGGFATTRTLVRAIEIAPTPDKNGVREGLWTQRYLWIGRDSMGYPITEQEETLRELLEDCFR